MQSAKKVRKSSLRLVNETVDFLELGKTLNDFPTDIVSEYKKNRSQIAPAAQIQIGAQYRWSNGVIPFVIDNNVPNADLIMLAIDHWHSMTDKIHLRQARPGDLDYVRFVLRICPRSTSPIFSFRYAFLT